MPCGYILFVPGQVKGCKSVGGAGYPRGHSDTQPAPGEIEMKTLRTHLTNPAALLMLLTSLSFLVAALLALTTELS